MTLGRIALNNLAGNRHSYAAFVLSSAMSVLVFFLFAAFIYHPSVTNGQIYGGSSVRMGLVACEYIILVFSFFFVWYSFTAFLKSRSKEFGLLELFGFTKGQLRLLVLAENTVIGLGAVLAGVGTGLLFSKLFLMALSALLRLEQPIPFYWPFRALTATVLCFALLFAVITLVAMRQVGAKQIVELIGEARKPRRLPRYSPWLVLLSAICLAAGYGLAAKMTASTMLFTMLPIVVMVVIGTYFLYTQLSVAVFRWLQGRKALYYRRVNLPIIAQMVFKLKDNARTLFLMSVLCAVVLTASGTLNVLYSGNRDQIIEHYPQAIGYVEHGIGKHSVISPDHVKKALSDDGYRLTYELAMVGVPGDVRLPGRQTDTTVLVVPLRDYNAQAARLPSVAPLTVADGKAWFIYPYKEATQTFVQAGDRLAIKFTGKKVMVTAEGQRNGMIAAPIGDATMLLVVSDEDYRTWSAGVPDQAKTAVYGFEFAGWESAKRTTRQIEAQIPPDQRTNFQSRTDAYENFRQFTSLSLFIGLFVSILFFLAAGSLIFFKLFTEMEEDRAQMKALMRIGTTVNEARRIVTTQIALLFFLPCAVGAVHGAFAMQALKNVMGMHVWKYGAVVLVVYVVLQAVYMGAARHQYLKRLLTGVYDD